jgi:hypothetical protein
MSFIAPGKSAMTNSMLVCKNKKIAFVTDFPGATAFS